MSRNQDGKASSQSGATAPDQLDILRSVVEGLADGIIVVDLEGTYRVFNTAAQRILGLGPLEAPPTDWAQKYGYSLFDGFIPYPTDQLPLGRALGGEKVPEVEIFLRNQFVPEGRWIEASAEPWRDHDGVQRGAVVHLRETDEEMSAGDLSERHLAIVEETSDFVVVTDDEGTITYVNPSFERITGFSSAEIVGRSADILHSLASTGESDGEVRRRVLAGDIFRGTVVHRSKAGEEIQASHVVLAPKGVAQRPRHIVSVARDLSERQESRKRGAEREAARAIQQRLYPAVAPSVPGFDIAGAADPADDLCGDYFDYFPILGGSLGLTVADVCGHGIGPSILMAQARAYLRLLAQTYDDVGEIFCRLNEILAVEGSEQEFVTQILVRLDPKRRELVYSNAGHPPGILMDATGAIREDLRAGAVPLGLYSDLTFPSSPPLKLRTGDLLVLYTDGLTECRGRDGSELGRPRIVDVIRRARHGTAREILSALGREIAVFRQGPPMDDVTTIVVRTEAS